VEDLFGFMKLAIPLFIQFFSILMVALLRLRLAIQRRIFAEERQEFIKSDKRNRV